MYIKQLYGGKLNRNAHIVKLITGKFAIETNTGKGEKMEINVNIPYFNTQNAASDWLVNNGYRAK